MDFISLINNGGRQNNQIIQKDADPVKYAEMVVKLCEKRKGLEKELSDTALEATVREDKALKLIEMKKGMGLFGISEIDYQAYLHKTETTSSQETLPAPTRAVPLVEPD